MCNVRWAMPLFAVSVILAAAGCGGGSTSSSGSAGAGAASTAVGGATTRPGGITKPGATLAVGQTARVPFRSPDSLSNAAPPYKLQVTVLSITRGSFSDFKGVQLDASEKAGTPYYLRFKVTNVGNGDLGSNTGGAISGVDDTGQDASSVTFFGSFPPCDETPPPKPFTRGKTWSSCYVYLVPGGIIGAHYNGFVDSYIESPVTWK